MFRGLSSLKDSLDVSVTLLPTTLQLTQVVTEPA